MKLRIADYYDGISSGYNELHGAEQRRKLSLIRSYIMEPVLDIGCGTGIASPDEAYGIDPSLDMIKQHPGFKEGRVIQGVAENLPFKDKQFFTAISLTVLHHCKDVDKALKEMKRVANRSILTVLKTANNFEEIEKAINRIFKIRERIDDEKDVIFIC